MVSGVMFPELCVAVPGIAVVDGTGTVVGVPPGFVVEVHPAKMMQDTSTSARMMIGVNPCFIVY
jgi:hypothetical protein